MTDQATFRAALLDPEAPRPPGLHGMGGLPARKRFDVYRNNVAVSLTEALEAAFPAIKSLVGEPFFKAMAGVFLRQHPPRSPLMMFYGAEMPDFLAGFPPAQSLPYLPDVARLELALRHAYHAADVPPLAPDALQQVAPEALGDLRFDLAPAVALLPSAYPLHAIYARAMQPDAPKPGATPQAVLVTRPDLDPQMDALGEADAAFVQALLSGQTLGAAAETGGDVGTLLGLLLARGALTTLKT